MLDESLASEIDVSIAQNTPVEVVWAPMRAASSAAEKPLSKKS